MTWLIPIDELSMEQIRAVESGTDENRLVMGAPGSGKTQILLHRAAHLRDKFNCSPQRFQIFVYTNVLKNYISSALDMLDLPSSCISTYDHWCSEYYKENISSSLPWNGKSRDFSATRSAVYEHVLAHVDAPIFDFIMVDEEL
jgi:superfamily I DNA/RNA helicase